MSIEVSSVFLRFKTNFKEKKRREQFVFKPLYSAFIVLLIVVHQKSLTICQHKLVLPKLYGLIFFTISLFAM